MHLFIWRGFHPRTVILTSFSFDKCSDFNMAIVSRGWLIFFWAIDLTLIAVYGTSVILHEHGIIDQTPSWLNLWSSTSLPDRMQYLKWFAASGVMLAVWRLAHRPLIGALGLVLGMVLLDDSLELHERIGAKLAGRFGWEGMFGLRNVDLGEIAVFAAMGLVALILLVWGFRRADSPDRRLAGWFVSAFGAMACLALMTDMLAIALVSDGAVSGLRRTMAMMANIADDGIELMLASLSLVFAMTRLAEIMPLRQLA